MTGECTLYLDPDTLNKNVSQRHKGSLYEQYQQQCSIMNVPGFMKISKHPPIE